MSDPTKSQHPLNVIEEVLIESFEDDLLIDLLDELEDGLNPHEERLGRAKRKRRAQLKARERHTILRR